MINYNQIRILSSKLGVTEEVIEKDYFIDLVLLFLSKDNYLKENLIFRGGTALKKIYFRDYRFSEDLDLLIESNENLRGYEEKLHEVLLKISSEYPVQLNKRLEFEKDRLQFYVIYDLISDIRAVKELKIDICKDTHISSYQKRRLLSLHREFDEEDIQIKTYDLEAIASDKIGRILDNTNEARDIYDLWFILKMTNSPENIKKEFKDKYEYNINLPNLIDAVLREEYKSTWKIRLKNQVINLPGYDILVKELESLIKEKLNG